MANCEHNLNKPGRCRKRAKMYVTYSAYFGENVGPNGPTKVYIPRVTARCHDHLDVPNKLAEGPIDKV